MLAANQQVSDSNPGSGLNVLGCRIPISNRDLALISLCEE